METAIRVEGLKKQFGALKAVDDISFQVEKGELFGFLGVNGAGKSTTINMLCTVLKPTGGNAEICGFKVGKENEQIRRQIGVVYQNNCLDERLTVKENLFIRGSLYEKNSKKLSANIRRICEILELESVYGRQFRMLSGGQKRRCEIARALLSTPQVMFLDEPTTGLDPATRKAVWESLDRLRREENMTIFLTTHYMEEAARALHIPVIDGGQLKEYGTPFSLKEMYAKDKLKLLPKAGQQQALEQMLKMIYALRAGQEMLTGFRNGSIIQIAPKEVYYFDAVDNKVFLYLEKEVYETKYRLYELEERLRGTDFFRISKSCIANLSKVKHFSPAFNGRFEATMRNGEKLVISRQYVSALKEKLGL